MPPRPIALTSALEVLNFALLLIIIFRTSYSENMGVERYLSPVSGKIATMIFPLFPGRFAN